MLKNGIPKLTMLMIKQYIQHRLQNSNDDVDIVNLFSVLPIELQRIIKRHLCPKTSLKKASFLSSYFFFRQINNIYVARYLTSISVI